MNLEGEVVGAGGYGLVISSNDGKLIAKLIYDINTCNSLVKEANIQKRAREILLLNKSIKVSIPEITDVFTKISKYKNKDYLCGIIMERIYPPLELFDAPEEAMQVHIALGYNGPDINNIWYVNDNPDLFRGFYTDARMIEALKPKLDVEEIAYQMGVSLRTLIDNGIIPYDIEFVLDENLNVRMVDFGLAEFGNIDPIKYLNINLTRYDVYIPRKGMKGYESFCQGYGVSIP